MATTNQINFNNIFQESLNKVYDVLFSIKKVALEEYLQKIDLVNLSKDIRHYYKALHQKLESMHTIHDIYNFILLHNRHLLQAHLFEISQETLRKVAEQTKEELKKENWIVEVREESIIPLESKISIDINNGKGCIVLQNFLENDLNKGKRERKFYLLLNNINDLNRFQNQYEFFINKYFGNRRFRFLRRHISKQFL